MSDYIEFENGSQIRASVKNGEKLNSFNDEKLKILGNGYENFHWSDNKWDHSYNRVIPSLFEEFSAYHASGVLISMPDSEVMEELSECKCSNKMELDEALKEFQELEKLDRETTCAISGVKISAELCYLRNKIANTIFGEGFLVGIYRDFYKEVDDCKECEESDAIF